MRSDVGNDKWKLFQLFHWQIAKQTYRLFVLWLALKRGKRKKIIERLV